MGLPVILSFGTGLAPCTMDPQTHKWSRAIVSGRYTTIFSYYPTGGDCTSQPFTLIIQRAAGSAPYIRDLERGWVAKQLINIRKRPYHDNGQPYARITQQGATVFANIRFFGYILADGGC
ncbi:hypothetical protein EYR41_009787 [Orbilia oligospora]|uniref:Uncharacterized protein n=1 Tax=Orbilia oligospora TaxID=2813651 RepID=A0A7C8P261_ORBOL|nr:hypothetical protein TWF751_002209 [Orbilia oligospora]TGJ65844.1 hypothetical protein EYR41_009787 [Orbilia oligospora]